MRATDGVRLFLHIGPHKTGTTYIQANAHAARAWWSERGLLYPDAGIGPLRDHQGHHVLAQALIEGRSEGSLRDVFGPVWQELRNHDSVLLSSEDFARVPLEAIPVLRQIVPKSFPITVIQFLRTRGDSLYSVWQERIKHGAAASLPEFVASALCAPYANHFINHGRLADAYGAIADETALLAYDSLLSSGSDIFTALVEHGLGRPELVPQLASSGRHNVRMSAFQTDTLRLLNFIHRGRASETSTLVRQRFIAAVSPGSEAATTFLAATRAAPPPSKLDLGNLDRAFRALDKDFLSRWGNRLRGPRETASLFPAQGPRKDYHYYSTEQLVGAFGSWDAIERFYESLEQSAGA